MEDVEKIINGLESLYKSMHLNQCYACSHEFIETANEFGTEILADAINILKEQQIVRCKDCYYHDENTGDNFCDCGNRPDDWFCAGGKRRE